MIVEIIAIWFLNLFDYIMSLYYIGKYGIAVELNPIMRWLFAHSPLDFIVKIGAVTICCVTLYLLRDYTIMKIAAIISLVIYAFVAIVHLTNLGI